MRKSIFKYQPKPKPKPKKSPHELNSKRIPQLLLIDSIEKIEPGAREETGKQNILLRQRSAFTILKAGLNLNLNIKCIYQATDMMHRFYSKVVQRQFNGIKVAGACIFLASKIFPPHYPLQVIIKEVMQIAKKHKFLHFGIPMDEATCLQYFVMLEATIFNLCPIKTLDFPFRKSINAMVDALPVNSPENVKKLAKVYYWSTLFITPFHVEYKSILIEAFCVWRALQATKDNMSPNWYKKFHDNLSVTILNAIDEEYIECRGHVVANITDSIKEFLQKFHQLERIELEEESKMTPLPIEMLSDDFYIKPDMEALMESPSPTVYPSPIDEFGFPGFDFRKEDICFRRGSGLTDSKEKLNSDGSCSTDSDFSDSNDSTDLPERELSLAKLSEPENKETFLESEISPILENETEMFSDGETSIASSERQLLTNQPPMPASNASADTEMSPGSSSLPAISASHFQLKSTCSLQLERDNVPDSQVGSTSFSSSNFPEFQNPNSSPSHSLYSRNDTESDYLMKNDSDSVSIKNQLLEEGPSPVQNSDASRNPSFLNDGLGKTLESEMNNVSLETKKKKSKKSKKKLSKSWSEPSKKTKKSKLPKSQAKKKQHSKKSPSKKEFKSLSQEKAPLQTNSVNTVQSNLDLALEQQLPRQELSLVPKCFPPPKITLRLVSQSSNSDCLSGDPTSRIWKVAQTDSLANRENYASDSSNSTDTDSLLPSKAKKPKRKFYSTASYHKSSSEDERSYEPTTHRTINKFFTHTSQRAQFSETPSSSTNTSDSDFSFPTTPMDSTNHQESSDNDYSYPRPDYYPNVSLENFNSFSYDGLWPIFIILNNQVVVSNVTINQRHWYHDYITSRTSFFNMYQRSTRRFHFSDGTFHQFSYTAQGESTPFTEYYSYPEQFPGEEYQSQYCSNQNEFNPELNYSQSNLQPNHDDPNADVLPAQNSQGEYDDSNGIEQESVFKNNYPQSYFQPGYRYVPQYLDSDCDEDYNFENSNYDADVDFDYPQSEVYTETNNSKRNVANKSSSKEGHQPFELETRLSNITSGNNTNAGLGSGYVDSLQYIEENFGQDHSEIDLEQHYGTYCYYPADDFPESSIPYYFDPDLDQNFSVFDYPDSEVGFEGVCRKYPKVLFQSRSSLPINEIHPLFESNVRPYDESPSRSEVESDFFEDYPQLPEKDNLQLRSEPNSFDVDEPICSEMNESYPRDQFEPEYSREILTTEQDNPFRFNQGSFQEQFDDDHYSTDYTQSDEDVAQDTNCESEYHDWKPTDKEVESQFTICSLLDSKHGHYSQNYPKLAINNIQHCPNQEENRYTEDFNELEKGKHLRGSEFIIEQIDKQLALDSTYTMEKDNNTRISENQKPGTPGLIPSLAGENNKQNRVPFSRFVSHNRKSRFGQTESDEENVKRRRKLERILKEKHFQSRFGLSSCKRRRLSSQVVYQKSDYDGSTEGSEYCPENRGHKVQEGHTFERFPGNVDAESDFYPSDYEENMPLTVKDLCYFNPNGQFSIVSKKLEQAFNSMRDSYIPCLDLIDNSTQNSN